MEEATVVGVTNDTTTGSTAAKASASKDSGHGNDNTQHDEEEDGVAAEEGPGEEEDGLEGADGGFRRQLRGGSNDEGDSLENGSARGHDGSSA